MMNRFINYCDESTSIKKGWVVFLSLSFIWHFKPIYIAVSLFSSEERIIVKYNNNDMCRTGHNELNYCITTSFKSIDTGEMLDCDLICDDVAHVLDDSSIYYAQIINLGFGQRKIINIYGDRGL